VTVVPLLTIGAAIALGLGVYAAVLWWRLHRRRRQLVAEVGAAAGRRDRALASIEVLARCVVQEQVSLAEAAIRISVLAQGLAGETDRALYQPFDELARAVAHIPILEGWQRLERSERARLTRELGELEQRHAAAVTAAARALLVRQ